MPNTAISETDATLSIRYENRQPVELTDFTESLYALADEYRRFAIANPDPAAPADTRLFVRQIKEGSILAMLAPMVPDALNMVEAANHVFDFTKHLKKVINLLQGGGDKKEKESFEKTTYENVAKILQPTSRDPGSQITIGTLNVTGGLHITVNSTEASALREAAAREVTSLKTPSKETHKKVLLYWYQARFAKKNKTGDKAIIESITTRPVKTIFLSDMEKSKMLSSSANPFFNAYLVDVSVETVQGREALYRIEHLYETETITDIQRALDPSDPLEQAEEDDDEEK